MDENFLNALDSSMLPWARRVVKEVGLSDRAAQSLATTISGEIQPADIRVLYAIRDSSPLTVQRRLFFFEDLQIWTRIIQPALSRPVHHSLPPERVQTAFAEMLALIPMYVSFVFAGDGLFEVLAKQGPEGSEVRRCSRFVRDNPLRAFRNAIAHGNWFLTATGSVRYWARKGEDRTDPLSEFEATADDMNFYLTFTRCVARTSLLAVAERLGDTGRALRNE